MNEKKRNCFIAIVVCIFTLLSAISITSTIYNHELRGQLDTIREQLAYTADTNRELGITIEKCRAITANLGEATSRNIGTVREAIDTLEEIRYYVAALEANCNYFDWDSYYNYWDTYYNDLLEVNNVKK